MEKLYSFFKRAVRLKVSLPSWLLAITCHVNLSNMASCFITVYKPRGQHKESANKMDVIILSNLIMEMRFHHIWHILLVRYKSQVLSTLKGRGLCKEGSLRVMSTISTINQP